MTGEGSPAAAVPGSAPDGPGWSSDAVDATPAPRPLTEADLPRLVALEAELFGVGAWTAGMLAEELAGPGRWYVGVDVAGELAGYAGLWFDGDVTQVMTLGVAETAQRRGIGERLLAALITRSRELGAQAVLLEVRVENEPAIRLYLRAGFEMFGRRRGYYQPENKDAWTLRLVL